MFGWPGDTGPTSIQQALRDLPLDRRLVVLEAETGSGKTEAAFLRFRHLFEAGEVDVLYFAVPTQAAATGLHGRIDRASRAWLGVEAVLALPGYLKAGQASGQALPGREVLWDDAPDARLRASRWAAETPRRYLAAAVAVGTVDQAMLAGLPVKWAHFRAATLSRAMLVVDEVHASDIYMREIMADVVRAHVARGGHALLMSATLGAAARAAWLNPGRRSQPARFPESGRELVGRWAGAASGIAQPGPAETCRHLRPGRHGPARGRGAACAGGFPWFPRVGGDRPISVSAPPWPIRAPCVGADRPRRAGQLLTRLEVPCEDQGRGRVVRTDGANPKTRFR